MSLKQADLLSRIKAKVDLHHQKRNKAFLRQLEFLCSYPGRTFAQGCGTGCNGNQADLVSFYRFEKVDSQLSELRRVRGEILMESLPKDISKIALIHDVTLLDYSKHPSKKDRRVIGDGRGHGYEYAVCLALDPATETTLGVMHENLVNSEGTDDKDTVNYVYEPFFSELQPALQKKLESNHKHQMAARILYLGKKHKDKKFIHIGDREFDDYFVMHSCKETGSDFVVRTTGKRNVHMVPTDWLTEGLTNQEKGHTRPAGMVCVRIDKVAQLVPLKPYKKLPVDARKRLTDPDTASRHIAVSIGAFSVQLYRDVKRDDSYYQTPYPMPLNVVVIRETDPATGTEPLCWIIFTSLPVSTQEEIKWIARLYELRWRIEPYFRLIKSGYSIENYRLSDGEKIAKLLVLISLAAMVIMNLKTQLGFSSQGRLNNEQFHKLKNAIKHPEDPTIDFRLRIFALIVNLGGWLGRRSDPIGPERLMRGALMFVSALQLSQQYPDLLKEAADQPELLRTMLALAL